MTNTILLTPGRVTLQSLEAIYRGAAAKLDAKCWPAVEASAEVVRLAARGEAAVSGAHPGFGSLAQKRIAADQTALLQRNLILSHCCGVGPATSPAIVRLMMALKIASLGRGASGVRPEVIQLLEAMLDR